MIDLLPLKSSTEATAGRGHPPGRPEASGSARAFDSTLQESGQSDSAAATGHTAQTEKACDAESEEESLTADQGSEVEAVPEETLRDADSDQQAEIPQDQLASLLETWSGVSASLGESAEVATAEGDISLDEEGTAQLSDAGRGPQLTARPTAPVSATVIAETSNQPDADMPGTSPPQPSPENSIEIGPATSRESAHAEARAVPSIPDIVSADPKPALLGKGADPVVAATEAVATTAPNSPDMPRAALLQADWRPAHIQTHAAMRQIADAVVSMQDNRVEIALSPEELGRVRMIVTGAERSAHVTVWVERPEIMDMMRRNLGLMTQHFSEAGLENASFEFREDSSSARSTAQAGEMTGGSDTEPDLTSLAPAHVIGLGSGSLSGDRRLDIRL